MSALRLRRRAFAFGGALALVTVVAIRAGAAPGDLDPTFGTNGKVTTDFRGMGGLANDLAVQPDGKIVAAGFAVIPRTSVPDFDRTESQFALARYNPDGTLDSTFGVDGRVTTDFPGPSEEAYAVALQPDGKIVAAGSTYFDFALARYNPDGSLDSTFGEDGRVTTDFGEASDAARGVAIQGDGKLVAGGYAYFSATEYDFALARYNPDGSLDPTFHGDGKVTTDFSGRYDTAFGVAIQADGKIVLAGDASVPRPPVRDIDFALARYDPDGSLDPTFDGDGRVTTAFRNPSGNNTGDFANAVAIQRDDRIVASGTALTLVEFGGITTGDFDFALARYNTDGSLDLSLEHDGTVTTDLGSAVDFPQDLAIQNDQRIVVGGFTDVTETYTYDFALVRYDGEGFLDGTFGGGDGLVTTDFNRRNDGAYSLAIQQDGKILAAGVGAGDFGVARYTVCRRSTMKSSALCPDTQANAAQESNAHLPAGTWIETPEWFDMLGMGAGGPDELVERMEAVLHDSGA